jgi:tetratricopeptide (TPR) repeat protein
METDAPSTPPPPPFCFVLMPFGRKPDTAGRMINFDSVYRDVIAPAVEKAGLEPVRADEEKIGGTIHKPMFERLLICPYAVADITGANPNVFYELGVRHAVKPRSTAIVFGEGTTLPFDVALVRGIAYRTDQSGEAVDIEAPIRAISGMLQVARNEPHDDSPVYQLVDGLPRWEVDHTKTDLFRKVVDYSKQYKERLAAAVRQGAEAVVAIANEEALANLYDVETGIIIDLFLSLRDVKAYPAMIELYRRMPPVLQGARLAREQFGFALNRTGQIDQAQKVLEAVIHDLGPSSETNGLLGRIYKDRWDSAKIERRPEARSLLRLAIDTYRRGFEVDWRDAYPGVNAVTLMEMQEKPDPDQPKLLPVVRYAAERKAATKPDYWDHATLLELAVLARDETDADNRLSDALAVARAPWELETTERNIGLIRIARTARGENADWIGRLEDELRQACGRLAPPAKQA